ncbi:glycosyltransferase family 4 protein [Bacillus spongiae]|uniref:Glycosyltransferase family 4 protein n=1 Tax=Bacillus spongiae TaxID=2683610 RepID=A0ABU8HJF3_9BACI
MSEKNNEQLEPLFIHPTLLSVMDRFYDVPTKSPIPSNLQSFGRKSSSILNKLNILYVTFLKYPNTGGLSNYITSLKSGCEKLGHHVDVLSPLQMSQAEFNNHIPFAAEQARSFMHNRYGVVHEKIVKNLSFLHVYTLFLERKQIDTYDVIHAQDLFALFILSSLNHRYKKPLLFTPHGLFTKSRLKFKKIQAGSLEELYFTEIEKQGLRAANEIIIIADAFRTPLASFDAKEEQMTTIHSGVEFNPLPKLQHKEKVIISCVARLSPRKGHEGLLHAFALLGEEASNVELWIIGDGVMKETLIKQVNDLQLSNVLFLGKRTDIAEILSHSDIYVLPTLNDNFPLALIEAMLSQQAIITTTCGGIPEMIQHERTGLLCEPGNVEELTNAIRYLLSNENARQTLGLAAKAYATDHFTSSVMATKMEKVYKSYIETINE